MIYQYPTLAPDDGEVIRLIHEIRNELRYHVNSSPVRWTGFLRRNTFARALQGSNSIEGINANLAEAVAIVDDEKPETLEEETIRALNGYRSAMTYILRLHDDPHMELNSQLIRSLHYMMISYDMTLMPGQWRPGPIFVVHEATKETVYEGPEANLVPNLIQELVDQVSEMRGSHDAIVVAAMAHLNLAMVHPFRDGNGRMARALHTLMLTRDGVVSPEFCSIEEWLGRNTDAYYDILAKTGEGRWNPENDALDWVRFCLIAHYQQAATIRKRSIQIGKVWSGIEDITAQFDINERMQIPLMDAAFGYTVKNLRYRTETDISEVVASRDLRHLCEIGLLEPVGEKRGRHYVAAGPIKGLAASRSDRSKISNPYEIVAAASLAEANPFRGQLSLELK